MPTRSLKIILGIEDRAQPTLPDRFFRPIFLPRLIPFRASTRSYENSRCLDLPPFHKRGNTFAGMQMRSLEARGHLPYNHRRNDSTLTQSVGTFHSDLTGINRLLTSPSSLPRIFSLFRPSITGNAIFLIGPRYFLKINIRNRYFTLSIRVLTNDKPWARTAIEINRASPNPTLVYIPFTYRSKLYVCFPIDRCSPLTISHLSTFPRTADAFPSFHQRQRLRTTREACWTLANALLFSLWIRKNRGKNLPKYLGKIYGFSTVTAREFRNRKREI